MEGHPWKSPYLSKVFPIGGVAPFAILSSLATAGWVPILPTATIDLLYSLGRMFLAYLVSLAFSLVYGYFAATERAFERVLIPILDILQSVPILGFFPVAIDFFVRYGGGPSSLIGPNLAAIFLVFTSMSWNMAFGVYESLKGLPLEMREATESFCSTGWQRFRRVILPSTVNRLVYNSQLSWTGGWFFLVAAEIIQTSSSTVTLPGIGSFLLVQAHAGHTLALLTGIAVLVVLIVILDIFVWRPLGRWAERYRYDTTPSGESDARSSPSGMATPFRRVAGTMVRTVVTGLRRAQTPFLSITQSVRRRGRGGASRPRTRTIVRYAVEGALLVAAWFVLIAIGVQVYQTLVGNPIPATVVAQIATVPMAMGLSILRVVAAFGISVAISLPLAIYLWRHARAARWGLPLVQIVASVPATALFPLLAVVFVRNVGPEVTSVLVVVTGMIWYLFFNVLSGLRGIPPDLEEAARSFGLGGRRLHRRLTFPATYPAFVTGAITAFGGGWNTLILAEYLQYQNSPPIVQVPGIGELLQLGNLESHATALLVVSLFTLILVVVVINEVVWKPLYRRVVDKYHFD